jgi:hypothetical protein
MVRISRGYNHDHDLDEPSTATVAFAFSFLVHCQNLRSCIFMLLLSNRERCLCVITECSLLLALVHHHGQLKHEMKDAC